MTTFRKFDAGAGQIKRHKKADCTVRALSVARGMSYAHAWSLLYSVQAAHNHCHFALFDYLREWPTLMGVKRYIPTPARAGVRRMTVQDFVALYPKGSYIVQVAHHATAVEDGVIIDTWNCARRCVYGAWEMAVTRG
jgi:hypothetical protein